MEEPLLGAGRAGARPWVIVSADVGEEPSRTVLVAPMSTNVKSVAPGRIPCRFQDKEVLILTGQLRAVARERLLDRAGQIDENAQNAVSRALSELLNPTFKLELNKALLQEEDRHHEFKEITSPNPVNSIKNTADEYAVAFLNSEGGTVLWGVRDSDRVVVGVRVAAGERDLLCREVSNKLQSIRPNVD